MKIAMLTEWWKPLIGWWQIYTDYQCEYLIKKYDCKIDLFTRKIRFEWTNYSNDETLNNNFSIYRTWFTSNFFNIFARLYSLIDMTILLYKKTKIEKYDLISAQAILPWIPAYIVGKLLNVPISYTIHGSMYLDFGKKWLYYYLEKFFFTKIKYDLLISVSHNILNHPNVNSNIKIIHPWVNFDKFKLDSNITKYDWLNLLFVWRLDWHKWLEYLIEGTSLLNKNDLINSWLNINIVWDWNLKQSLEELIKEKHLEQFFNLKWRLSDEDINTEYQKNNIFILPSLAEWQPVVVFEAFATKLPVITTDVWDNKYFIEDWVNWFLINPWSVDEIKNILEKIIKISKTELENMWINWYNLVKTKLSWDKIVDEIYGEYLKIINV